MIAVDHRDESGITCCEGTLEREKSVSVPNAIEVVTLFVDDITQAKTFYESVFEPEVVYEDEVSCVLDFEGTAVNLLQISQAPELVVPVPVAPAAAGARVLLTIKVADVDATCAVLRDRGVRLLNGPIDRPWGRRTAAFADPSGHVWEVAQELG
ncbi:VOC family protein [Rhodanobacter ginsengisoli]|uniref:VOC family protein n=1 Tax=Rhodanobacter ginsengisoli TaxID=418646 RepID=A0ABW0QHU3_9GAMM